MENLAWASERYRGKIISCLGDSITQGIGNQNVSWTHMLQELLPHSRVLNYGVAGTRVAMDAEDPEGAFVRRLGGIDPQSDVIIVFGGINDFNHGHPLGDPDSRDPFTFYGAWNTIADELQLHWPMADLLFITPMKAFGFKDYPHWNTENASGHRLVDYRQAILEVALSHSILTLDLFAESGLTPDCPAIKERLLSDGLHPTKEGYLRLTRKIANVLFCRM